MWCQNSLRPVEKMLVATKFLVGLVWDMTTMSVISSKISYNVKYKHASGLNCLLCPTPERVAVPFGVFCCETCGHKPERDSWTHNQSSGCLATVTSLD